MNAPDYRLAEQPVPLLLEGDEMSVHVVLASLSLALLLAVIALLREKRLRLALQVLLRRLLTHWRSHGQGQS